MGSAYRYRLTRWLEGGRGRVCWVMLNPSTADATSDDPTIRRVLGFSRDHGFGELQVVNLFAARATTPRELGQLGLAVDVAGPGNNRAIATAIGAADTVVVAWGAAVPTVLRREAERRIRSILRRCGALGRTPWCLSTTRDGHPRHPLYVPASTTLQPWAPRPLSSPRDPSRSA